MPRAALTVAEVFRRYGDTFRAEVGAALSTAHSRVMTAIEQCRTAALGGHVEQCDHCGHRGIVPCGVELGEWQLPLVPYESSMLRHVSNQAVGRGQCVQGADQVT